VNDVVVKKFTFAISFPDEILVRTGRVKIARASEVSAETLTQASVYAM